MKFHHKTLDNGLEIIAEENEVALSTAMGFFVRTGSRDETDKISGVSHFLEHMAFKGGAKRDAAAVNRELDRLGGFGNAFTNEECTGFYVKILPELQERAIDLLAELMRPALRPEDFEPEKLVVLEEIGMYDDLPPYGLDEKWREHFWPDHPLSRSILGSRETVGALTPDAMREYHERRYAPNNLVFAAAGRLDFDKLTSWVAASCGSWRPQETGRETKRAVGRRGVKTLMKEDAVQEHVFQFVDGPNSAAPDRIAALMLALALGNDVGSRFFWELVDSGRADSATLSTYCYSDSGAFVSNLVCDPKDVKKNLDSMREILADASTNGVTEPELARVKNKTLTSCAIAGESPFSRMFSIIDEWLSTGKYRSTADDLQKVRSITLDDVNAIMKKYPLDDPFTIAIGPLESLD